MGAPPNTCTSHLAYLCWQSGDCIIHNEHREERKTKCDYCELETRNIARSAEWVLPKIPARHIWRIYADGVVSVSSTMNIEKSAKQNVTIVTRETRNIASSS